MKTEEKEKIEKPSLFWLATEGARAAFEYGSFFPYKLLFSKQFDGKGYPVMILPGFMSSDRSTKPLRNFLNSTGYIAQGWNLGRNYGDEEDIEFLLDQIDKLYFKHRKKISLIGWSLGGVFARQIAKMRPHLIRQVITLGSPFSGVTVSNHATWLHKFITAGKGDEIIDKEFLKDLPKPAPVPTTAIFSKQDGIVPWECCIEKEENDIHQNIQVYGSHLGYGVNPLVIEIIMDRLQYGPENWVKFTPKNKLVDTLLYPA